MTHVKARRRARPCARAARSCSTRTIRSWSRSRARSPDRHVTSSSPISSGAHAARARDVVDEAPRARAARVVFAEGGAIVCVRGDEVDDARARRRVPDHLRRRRALQRRERARRRRDGARARPRPTRRSSRGLRGFGMQRQPGPRRDRRRANGVRRDARLRSQPRGRARRHGARRVAPAGQPGRPLRRHRQRGRSQRSTRSARCRRSIAEARPRRVSSASSRGYLRGRLPGEVPARVSPLAVRVSASPTSAIATADSEVDALAPHPRRGEARTTS